jgi:hypothetical protein
MFWKYRPQKALPKYQWAAEKRHFGLFERQGMKHLLKGK